MYNVFFFLCCMEVFMYSNYNPSFNIDRLNRMKDEIENQIKSYQTMQPPVNNFITTGQTASKDLIEWRILNENEEVDNLYVSNKTLFINDNLMILKGVDGSLEKWEVKKIYPIDKKDEKINALEEEIRKLKEMVKDEHKQSISTTREFNKSTINDDGITEPKSKAISKSIAK